MHLDGNEAIFDPTPRADPKSVAHLNDRAELTAMGIKSDKKIAFLIRALHSTAAGRLEELQTQRNLYPIETEFMGNINIVAGVLDQLDKALLSDEPLTDELGIPLAE